MPSVSPDLGAGTTVTFSSGYVSKALSLDWSGVTREAVATTTLDTTGGKTFIPSDTYDPGTLEGSMQLNTANSPPITGAAETVTLTFPDTSTWAASGFMTDVSAGLEPEGVMTIDFTIKLSGDITFTPTV